MSRFNNIDKSLEELSAKLGAKLTKGRPDYPPIHQNIEERRIDWIEEDVFKAIIFQPTFESGGVSQKEWDLINIAWCHMDEEGHETQWMATLVDKKNSEIIESNIDSLLIISENNLKSIDKEDLKWV